MWAKISDHLLKVYVRSRVALAGWWAEARGLQTLEWVALAIVILAFLGAVALYLKNSGENTIGKTVVDTIAYFFNQLMKGQ